MKSIFKTMTIIIAMSFVGACGGSVSSGKVLVDINGDKITEGDINFLGQINPRIKIQIANPAGRKRVLDNLVEQDLLYQEAIKEGINRDPKVKAKIDLYRRVIIAQSLVDSEIQKAAKKYYDENQDEFKKLALSHIMVGYVSADKLKKKKKRAKNERSEEEALKLANKIKARIDKGEDFAAVAKEVSEDNATKRRGGALGKASKNERRLEARGFGPLLEKSFQMKVGEVSGPIKTSKGYHLITVTGGVELETFDKAKEGIAFKLRGNTRNDLIARLKKEATIVYPEEERAKKKAAEKKKAAAKKKEAKKESGAQTSKAPETPSE